MATLIETVKGFGGLIASVFKWDNDVASQAVTLVGTDGVAYSAGGGASSAVSATNSSAVALGISGVFTGTAVDVTGYSSVTVGVFADQASATDGLSIQQSSDGTNWDSVDAYTIPASTGKVFGVVPNLKWMRIVYTNGGVAQGAFRLQSILHVYSVRGASVRPQDARTNDNDMDEVLSYLMGYNGTTWDRLRGTTANGLAADVTRIIPGVTATALGKAEDAVAASGDTGVFALGVRRDALTVSASATGDYNELATGQYGEVLVRQYEKQARTYSCAVNVAAAAAATDIATITGSATTTVFVTKVVISGIQTTAGLNDVLLIKRSTADTGGTSAAGTALPHDSGDAAATATVLAYTANPTTGTTVAALRRNYLPIAGVTSVVNPVVEYKFGELGRPLILRGIAQVLAVNLNGATITGGTFDVNFEWFEI